MKAAFIRKAGIAVFSNRTSTSLRRGSMPTIAEPRTNRRIAPAVWNVLVMKW
jgi:hypothetical protein